MVQHYGDTDILTEPPTDSATQRYEAARAAAHRAMTSVTVIPDRPPVQPPADPELPVYRGFKFGAAFFGWLITVSMTVLLTAVIAGVGVGAAYILEYTRADAERRPGTAAITAAAILVLMLCLAIYTGGYVAGRLARFDGLRQGFGVWMMALLVTLLAAGAGAALNTQYDLVGRVNRPNVPLSNDALTTGGMITAGALLILPLLAALLGGRTGQRYHDKIDSMLD
ncbi:MAG: hypothetical protein QOF10_252 [Kribbellaceae bacterium]|nr:hypothetical protein [Kribbellaceae bacterium]